MGKKPFVKERISLWEIALNENGGHARRTFSQARRIGHNEGKAAHGGQVASYEEEATRQSLDNCN